MLRSVGRYVHQLVIVSYLNSHLHSFHDFSAACLIGGRFIKHETKHIDIMNIIVATPGRLLQHLDESPGFDTSNLQFMGTTICGSVSPLFQFHCSFIAVLFQLWMKQTRWWIWDSLKPCRTFYPIYLRHLLDKRFFFQRHFPLQLAVLHSSP